MPADTPFLHDVYEFEFLGMKLMQALKSWSDKVAFRNAVHEYIKRDGASIERMGRKPAEFRFNLFFTGDNWRIEYGNFLAKLSQNNKGPLVHPLLGPMQAAADIVEGSVTVATGRNLVELSLAVTEDRVDVLLVEEQEPRPLEQSAAAQEAAASARDQAVQNYPQTAPLVQTYTDAVVSYTTAAEASLLDYSQVLGLGALLAQVGRTADLAAQALLVDPAVLVEADAYDALSTIERGYAACLAMQEALLAQIAPPVVRTIVASQPLITLCQGWYGGADAVRYADLIQQYQVVHDPNWVPQGTSLLIPPPTRSAA